MTYENKLLLSLVNNISERDKIYCLKANLTLKEILYLHTLNNTKELDKKLSLFKTYKCSFVDECQYPLNLCKVNVPPFRLASTKSFPSPFDYYIGVIGSYNPTFSSVEDYYMFGKNLSQTKIGLVTLNFGGISKIVQKGFLDGNKTPFSLLASGFSILNSCYQNNDQAIYLSPFEVSDKPSKLSFIHSYEILGSLIDALIIFQCSEEDDCKRAISSVLDCGTNIFVHSSAVKDNKANSISYALTKQGCNIISTVDELF